MNSCEKCNSPHYCVCEQLIAYGNCRTCYKYGTYCTCISGLRIEIPSEPSKKRRRKGYKCPDPPRASSVPVFHW